MNTISLAVQMFNYHFALSAIISMKRVCVIKQYDEKDCDIFCDVDNLYNRFILLGEDLWSPKIIFKYIDIQMAVSNNNNNYLTLLLYPFKLRIQHE